MLLTINDMPPGWTVDKSSTSSNAAPPCLKSAEAVTKVNLAHADANFLGDPSGVPALYEKLAYFASGPKAHAAVAAFAATLPNCNDYTYANSGNQVTLTFAAMSFPSMGDESNGYSISISSQGMRAAIDLVMVRKGKYVLLVGLGDISPDTTQLQHFATTALGRLH